MLTAKQTMCPLAVSTWWAAEHLDVPAPTLLPRTFQVPYIKVTNRILPPFLPSNKNSQAIGMQGKTQISHQTCRLTQVVQMVGSLVDEVVGNGPHSALLYGLDLQDFAADEQLHTYLKALMAEVGPLPCFLAAQQISASCCELSSAAAICGSDTVPDSKQVLHLEVYFWICFEATSRKCVKMHCIKALMNCGASHHVPEKKVKVKRF